MLNCEVLDQKNTLLNKSVSELRTKRFIKKMSFKRVLIVENANLRLIFWFKSLTRQGKPQNKFFGDNNGIKMASFPGLTYIIY